MKYYFLVLLLLLVLKLNAMTYTRHSLSQDHKLIGGYKIIDQGVVLRKSDFFNNFMKAKSSSTIGLVGSSESNGDDAKWRWYYIGENKFFWQSEQYKTFVSARDDGSITLMDKPDTW